MIRPHKYMNLNTCVLKISEIIIRRLKKSTAITILELFDLIVEELGMDARYNVVPALNFLFLADQIEFDVELDAIVFRQLVGAE